MSPDPDEVVLFDRTKAVPGSLAALFFSYPHKGKYDNVATVRIGGKPTSEKVLAFLRARAETPEFEGQYVEVVGSRPDGKVMRFQARRRDLLHHFIGLRAIGVWVRTYRSLAIVQFAKEASRTAFSYDGSFTTERIERMATRQTILEKRKPGRESISAEDARKHTLAEWADARVELALDMAAFFRRKRAEGLRPSKNAKLFLDGGPCKNLIYVMFFRNPDDPVYPVLVYVGQTTQTLAARMSEHFSDHRTFADLLCLATAPVDVVCLVLNVVEPDDGISLNDMEAEAIAIFQGVSPLGANMLHGASRFRKKNNTSG
jgi:hypothetical protein